MASDQIICRLISLHIDWFLSSFAKEDFIGIGRLYCRNHIHMFKSNLYHLHFKRYKLNFDLVLRFWHLTLKWVPGAEFKVFWSNPIQHGIIFILMASNQIICRLISLHIDWFLSSFVKVPYAITGRVHNSVRHLHFDLPSIQDRFPFFYCNITSRNHLLWLTFFLPL